MKKILAPLFILSFLAVNSLAQDWLPISTADTCHYALGNVDFATHSLFVDSIQSDSIKTVYYLNKTPVKCDSCNWLKQYIISHNIRPSYYTSSIIYFEGHQFLQKKAEVYKNGDIILSKPGHYLLRTQAKAGETWMFDSLRTAKIIARSQIDILGDKDSVISFHLSGDDTIILSKNHGIISFPDFDNSGVYRLIGIEGNPNGFNMPGVWELHQWSVGDMFRYKSTAGASSWYETEELIYEVSGKTIKDDSVLYELEGARFVVRRDYDYGTFKNYYEPYEKVIRFGLNEIAELQNFKAAKLYHGQAVYTQDSSRILGIYFDQDINNELIIKVSDLLPNDIFLYYTPFTAFPEVYGKVLIPALYPTSPYFDFCYEYKLNIGLTNLRFSMGEGYSRKTLVGYRKDGVVYGEINAIEMDTPPKELNIYPNPVQDVLNINTTGNEKNLTIEVVNLSGQIVRSAYFENNNEKLSLDVSQLPKGIYLLKIFSVSDTKTFRFIKN